MDNNAQPTILIIDDEEELCLLLVHMLGSMGFEIDYAITLNEGNRKLFLMQPDLVLMDLNLPDGSGFHMIPRLKLLNSPFVIISAYDDFRELALRKGAADFISKPFSLKRLITSIAKITNK